MQKKGKIMETGYQGSIEDYPFGDQDISKFYPVILRRIKYLGQNKPRYIIGIDSSEKDNNAYCISRVIGNDMQIIFSKVIKDEKEFEAEVNNLAKYFNAVKIRQI